MQITKHARYTRYGIMLYIYNIIYVIHYNYIFISYRYMRYGKGFDESEIRKLFKDGKSEITFADYLGLM
jgi:ATP-dependent Zn protease